ncbi:sorting nexin [Anaeramoeba flamelloides]|uniref:Sorting nexin n=1 Tax=Anaeramoeba flamelloides TaxID=1746091 RepID=A0ABQ8YCC5_9EUKA|nr:sorting nexin [Anaeramoeba flamelloides]
MSNQTKVESSTFPNYFQLQQENYLYSLNNQKLQKETTQNISHQQQDTNLSPTNNHHHNSNLEEFQKTLSSSFSISPSSSSSKSTTQSSESSSGFNSDSNSRLESTSSSEFSESSTANRTKEKTKTFLNPNKKQEVFDGYQIKNRIITKNKNKSESEIGNQNEDQKTLNNLDHQNVYYNKHKNSQKEAKSCSHWKIQISSPETLWAGVSKFTIYKVYSMRINSEKMNGNNYHCDFDFSANNPKNQNESRNKNKNKKNNKKNNKKKNKKKKNKQNVVKRRYSDFAWLRENLVQDFPGVIVPALPEKQIVSKFTNKILEMRRKKFETFLIKVSYHSLLSLSRAFAMFLEKEIVNIFKIKLNRDQVSYGINRLHTNYLEYQYNPIQLEGLPPRIKTWENLHTILKQLLIEITKFGNIQEKIPKRLKYFSLSILELNQCQASPHLTNSISFTFEQLNVLKKKIQDENQISNFLLRESINDLISNCLEISKNNNKRNAMDEEYQNSIKYETKCLNKFQDFQNKKKKKKSSSNLHILKKDYQSSVKKKRLLHSKLQKMTSVFIDELNKMENNRSNFIKASLLDFSQKQFEINKHSTEIWASITKNLQNLDKNKMKQTFSMKKK